MTPKKARKRGVLTGELVESEVEGEAPSLASVWKCPECGGQIQIIVAPNGIPKQPFICVDGTPMVAGEEH